MQEAKNGARDSLWSGLVGAFSCLLGRRAQATPTTTRMITENQNANTYYMNTFLQRADRQTWFVLTLAHLSFSSFPLSPRTVRLPPAPATLPRPLLTNTQRTHPRLFHYHVGRNRRHKQSMRLEARTNSMRPTYVPTYVLT